MIRVGKRDNSCHMAGHYMELYAKLHHSNFSITTPSLAKETVHMITDTLFHTKLVIREWKKDNSYHMSKHYNSLSSNS